MAERIQRKRIAGWKKPDDTVCVDRTSRFGNPFTAASAAEHFGVTLDDARAIVTDRYYLWLAGEDAGDWDVYHAGSRTYNRRWMLAHLGDLAGKNLACFCPLPASGQPDHCHAAILLSIVAKGRVA